VAADLKQNCTPTSELLPVVCSHLSQQIWPLIRSCKCRLVGSKAQHTQALWAQQHRILAIQRLTSLANFLRDGFGIPQQPPQKRSPHDWDEWRGGRSPLQTPPPKPLHPGLGQLVTNEPVEFTNNQLKFKTSGKLLITFKEFREYTSN